ncbi:MAG: hypothetical protein IJO78_03125 [Erysipelotrichaceae bacterium]|nr:hypothetical protein [Erysipelotrichaceae bacterium]
MTTTRIKKWGNGSGILLPKVLLDMLALKVDDLLSIELVDNKIVLSPNKKSKTLEELFEGFEGETIQEEYWLDEPRGKEII